MTIIPINRLPLEFIESASGANTFTVKSNPRSLIRNSALLAIFNFLGEVIKFNGISFFHDQNKA
tara:strand:+ start:79 stop:270 length:192 start_codon:yes stop_codon:yes gene_type:complete